MIWNLIYLHFVYLLITSKQFFIRFCRFSSTVWIIWQTIWNLLLIAAKQFFVEFCRFSQVLYLCTHQTTYVIDPPIAQSNFFIIFILSIRQLYFCNHVDDMKFNILEANIMQIQWRTNIFCNRCNFPQKIPIWKLKLSSRISFVFFSFCHGFIRILAQFLHGPAWTRVEYLSVHVGRKERRNTRQLVKQQFRFFRC